MKRYKPLLIILFIVGCDNSNYKGEAYIHKYWSPSLELIEPVNFPLYEFSGRSEGEDAPHEN